MNDRAGLVRAIVATLRGYWTHAESYQKFLYVIGGLLVASAVFHLAVLLVTGGSWQGSVSWRKPILFGEAFGLTCVSFAWIMTFLPKRALPGWLLAGTLGLANSGEVIWVSMQQWRGVPSHFNFETAFDAAAFNVGGGGLIFFTGVVIVAVTLWTFVSLDAPPSIAVAIRAGLVLLIAAQVFGVLIIQNGIAKVLDPQTGEFLSEGLDSASLFGQAGMMKIPHGLALHANQALPVLALLLLFTGWEESRRTRVVLVATAGYVGLLAVGTLQTFTSRAPLDLAWLAALMLAVSVLLTAVPYAAALAALRRPAAPRNVVY